MPNVRRSRIFSAHNQTAIETQQHLPSANEEEIASLRKRVRELSAFLESASIGLHRVGPDGTILWANQAELDFLGYTASEYIGHNIVEFHADRDVIDNILNCLSRGGKLCNHEARLRARDGSIKTVLIDSSVLFEGGKFLHTQCFTRDVTNQKAAEEQLRRIAFIVDHSGWSVATINSTSNVIEFCNSAFAQMHGFTCEELIGAPLEKTISPEWMAVWPTHHLRLAEGGDYVYESVHRRKNGETFPVQTHATTFLDAEGRTIFRASVFTDITQQKLTEQSLLESEALKAAMLNSGLDAFIAIDHQSRILEFNAAAQNIFGYKRSDVMGRRLDELIIPPSLREYHARGMAAYLATGESKILGKRIEIQAMRSDGSEFPCELAIVRVNRQGPAVFTSFIRDITDRKKIQAALVEAKAALELHARQLETTVAERTAHLKATIGELERFSYSLSHDMRAPLRAIHSFIEMVLEDAGSRLDDSEIQLLEKAVHAAARLDRLIQDVLSYSKVASDSIDLRPIDISALIGQIIDERPEFRPPVSEMSIECRLPLVLGHEAYLTQIFTNLLSNAVKFVAPGVQPKVRILCESRDDRTRIWFEDNGVGIPPEATERIFGLFQRMHSQDEYPGTGIGLAIVRKAAERMHGVVGVEPGRNGGSRFFLELPGGAIQNDPAQD